METKNHVEHVDEAHFADKVLKAEGPVLVDFWAPWCGPCRALAPTLEEIAGQYGGRLRVVKVNVDEASQTAVAYQVRSIPTLALFEKGQVVETLVGLLDKTQLAEFVDRNLKG